VSIFFESHRGHGHLLWVLCVVRQRSMRRADHSSRGVLPTVVRRCVWSRNLKNEEAMTRVGSQRHSKKKGSLLCSIQGSVTAHLTPVALPAWPYADIPARLFHLPTILGKEGVCNPSVFCVPSVRKRRQENGVPARPTTSQQRRAS
jgi:hypothetical protein